MIAICEECGKQYRIDPAKIKGKTASFNCKACHHRITVNKPSSEIPMPDTPQMPSSQPPEPAAAPTKTAEKSGTSMLKSRRGTRFGLAEKMVSLMLAVTLIPLLVFWGLTFKQTNSRIQEDSEKIILQTSEKLANSITEWMDKNIRVLRLAANLPDVVSMQPFNQEPVLTFIQEEYPWMQKIFTIDTNGRTISSNIGQPTSDYSKLPFFRNIIAGNATAWQTVNLEPSKLPALLLAVPITTGDRVIGVLAGILSIDPISRQIMTGITERSGISFVVDANGRVMAHHDQQMVMNAKNLNSHALLTAFRTGQKGVVTYNDKNGAPHVGHARQTALGWTVAVQAEEKEVFRILKEAQFFAYIYLGIIMIIVILIAMFAGRTMTRPIKELTVAADRISVGELDVEIKVKRKDEIGDLAEAVLRMQDSLRLSIERLRRRR